MILSRIFFRTRQKSLSLVNCTFSSIPTRKEFKNKPRWLNQSWSRGYPTDTKLVSSGLENSFAYQTVKNAGIAVIDATGDFSILERVIKAGGSEQALEELTAQVQKLSDTELVALLTGLEKIKDIEFFPKIWKIIDVEGSKRIPNGNPSIVLAGAMRIYDLQLTYRSEWIWSCLKRFCRRLDRLTKAEMLQVMFLTNIRRKIPIQYSGFDVQYHLVSHFDDLDLDQMALVSLAFFKSETKLQNKVIMSKVMRKMVDEANTSTGLTLAMLSKIIRYSLPITLADELYVVQSRLVEEIPRLELKSLTHLALSGTNVLLYNKEFIGVIVDRMKANISEIRLKDIERILHVMSLFSHKDDEFVQKVLQELKKREAEIQAFPKSLLSLVNFLAILEHIPLDWVNHVFSKKFLYETYESSLRKLGTELIFLDKTVEIEKPEYGGNRLPHKLLSQSAKVMKFSVKNNLTGTQRFSYQLEEILKQIYGERNVTYMAVLPHYHFADFVLGLDGNLKPVPVPQNWAVHRWGEVKHLPDDKHLWLVILAGGWNTNVRNTGEPLGLLRAKLRQLRILGFHPIVVGYNVWRESTDKVKIITEMLDAEVSKIRGQGKIRQTEV